MIIWDILINHSGKRSERVISILSAIHKSNDEFSKNTHRRERHFIVAAILLLQGDHSFLSSDEPTLGNAADISKTIQVMTLRPIPIQGEKGRGSCQDRPLRPPACAE